MKMNILKKWLNENKSLYFFMPDGPFGRPFDNQYYLIEVISSDELLSIILSDNMKFNFVGRHVVVIEDESRITIKNFESLIFEKDNMIVNNYEEGEFILVEG